MTHQDLIKKLKQTAAGQPDATWVAQNRELLLSQIRAQQDSRLELFSTRSAGLVWTCFQVLMPQRLAMRAVLAVVLVVVLVLGSSVTTVWADRSLPGDMLYSVKLTSEKVQLTLTTDTEAKAKLSVEFAGKRLAEVAQLQSAVGESSATQSKKIEQTLESYKKNIEQVSENLNELQSVGRSGQAVAVASLVNEQMGQYAQTLEKSRETLVSGEPETKVLQEALTASDQAGDQALDIILQERLAGQKSIDNQALRELLQTKIEQTNQKVGELNQKIKTFNQAPASTEIPVAAVDDSQLTKAEDNATDAAQALQAAKALLDDGDLVTSLTKIKESRELIRQAESSVFFVVEIQKTGTEPEVKGEATEQPAAEVK